jgi:carbonic anhydrase
MVEHTTEWDYNESFLWGNDYPQCKGMLQSPIDLDTNLIKECRTLCNITPRIKPSKTCFVNYQNKTISIKYGTGSFTEYQGTLYELKEITIHTPSLHTIDGEKLDMEICMIHKLTDNSSDIAGLNVCCLFEEGPHFGNAEQFISQIIYDIPSQDIDYDKEISISSEWTAKWLIPEKSSYFSYNGSLPYPPCTQMYKTFVYEKVGKIGKTNIDTLKRYLGNAARPVKSIGSRTIFYTPFMETASSEKKIYKSNNKYLKCYKENRAIRNVVEQTPTGTLEADSNETSVGFNKSTMAYISSITMSVVILLLFVNAYYFTLWLFRHFYIQKIIRMLSGRDKITFETIKLWKSCQGKILTAKDKLRMKEAAERSSEISATSGQMPTMGQRGPTNAMPGNTFSQSGQTMGRRS